MKAHNYTFILVVIFMAAGSAQAAGDWDIYSDAVIEDGDIFSNVRVYDTPPDHTTVDMTGGMVDSMGAYLESTINVSGGDISSLSGNDYSEINVSGGYVYGIESRDHSIVNFLNGANLFAPRARDFGTINMIDGTVDHLGSNESGTINLYGGKIIDRLVALDVSSVNIYGYDLVKISYGGSYGYGQVYGFWNDGTPFTIDLNSDETYSHINLIPEPSTMLILGLGSLIIKRKR